MLIVCAPFNGQVETEETEKGIRKVELKLEMVITKTCVTTWTFHTTVG